MLPIFRIWAVARYEAKMLVRTWAFWIFVLLTAASQIFMLLMPYYWNGLGLVPAFIPLRGFVGYSFLLAWMVAVLAPELLAADRRAHSSRIVYTRPVTNAELLSGKLLGITTVLMGLTVTIALLLWIAATVFIENMPAVPLTYILYPVLLILPMLVFLLGLAILLDAVVRNREILMTVLLAVVGVMVFSLDSGRDHLFDFRGVWMPLLYSDVTGFGNMGSVLFQRGMYFLLGICFACLAIPFLRRPPHRGRERVVCLSLAFLFAAGAFALGMGYFSPIARGRELRVEINALNDRLSDMPRVTLDSCHIDLVHRGRTIEAVAALRFTNHTAAPLDRYTFSLNPGLRVTGITGDTGELPFQRRVHVLTVTPSHPLAPGGVDSLTVSYRGAIDEEACYPDIPESERDMDNIHYTCAIDRRYAFLTPRYVLLTREALWYPVPGTPPGPRAVVGSEYDFSRYELSVKTGRGLTAISQGRAETAGNGVTRFHPETPLPKISLVIGPYEHRKTVVDSVEYGVYVIRGHDFFSRHFREQKPEKLAGVIRRTRAEAEVRIGLKYPFARFSLVETPVQFLTHPRLRVPDAETIQPELVLFPERGMFHGNNPVRSIDHLERANGMQNPPLTPVEIREQAFGNFVRESLLTVDTSVRAQMRWRKHYRIRQSFGGIGYFSRSPYEYTMTSFPEFFSFRNGFSTESGSPLGLALGRYLESGLSHLQTFGDGKYENSPDDEVATRALSGASLAEVLSDPGKRDAAREALYFKSVLLFTLLKAKSGVPGYKFDSFLREYLERNRFRTVSAESLAFGLHSAFGVDVQALLDRWENAKVLPRFEVSDVRHTEVPVPGGSEYHVRFTLYNPEPVEGAVSAVLSDGETGRVIAMNGNEAREIHLVTSSLCHILYITPPLSQHIPSWFYVVIGPPVKSVADPSPAGERVVSPPGAAPDSVGIIVDNIDTGFRIIPKRNIKLIERARERFGKTPAKLTTAFNEIHPPAQWSLAVELHFYGHTEHSAQYIKGGKGEERVRWEADIPESGEYTILYHNIFFFQDQRTRNPPLLKDFHFRIGHADGVADVEMNYHGEFPPWSPLGTYRLEKGTAWVELSDETKGKMVYADAVRWTKKRR